MNSISRRKLTLSILAGTLSASVLGGCSTIGLEPFKVSPEDQALKAALAALPITHPDRKEDFDEWWSHLVSHTKAISISDNRVNIQASGTTFAKEDISQHNFLLRAAAETLRAEKDGFVITQLDYHNDGIPLPSLGPSLNISNRRWIGNYEDLREDRNEQNIFSSRRNIRNKAIDGVILQLNKDEFPNRDRFSASELYSNLLNHQGN